jgi:hypothetical protein
MARPTDETAPSRCRQPRRTPGAATHPGQREDSVCLPPPRRCGGVALPRYAIPWYHGIVLPGKKEKREKFVCICISRNLHLCGPRTLPEHRKGLLRQASVPREGVPAPEERREASARGRGACGDSLTMLRAFSRAIAPSLFATDLSLTSPVANFLMKELSSAMWSPPFDVCFAEHGLNRCLRRDVAWAAARAHIS